MYTKKFGKNLKVILDIRGITHEKAAELFGVSVPMITKYTQGRNMPLGEQLVKISVILGVSLDSLVGLKPLVITSEGDAPPVKKKIA